MFSSDDIVKKSIPIFIKKTLDDINNKKFLSDTIRKTPVIKKKDISMNIQSIPITVKTIDTLQTIQNNDIDKSKKNIVVSNIV